MSQQKTQGDTETAFGMSVLEFSLPLYQALEKNGNVFMSPYSVSAALMLLLLGTDGETKTELETALKVQGLSENAAHLGYSLLHKSLTDKSGKGLLVAIANRIFSKQGVALKKIFSTDALKYYGSEVELLDFGKQPDESRRRINSWIEKQTNDKIKDLIPPNLLDDNTMMVLTNAIYFKGDWELKFDEKRTSKQPFYTNDKDTVNVDMMSDKKKAMSGDSEELDCKCLQLPYKGEQLSMLILLPNKRMGLEKLENKITVSSLQNAISKMYKQETIISIPKFRIESSFELTKILPKLGITKIFSRSANFSGIFEDGGDGVFVSDVIHKAFVEVNEEGTEAAAATAIMMTRMCMIPAQPFVFKADHPFLFVIRDNSCGTILFMGRYASPN